MCHSGASTVAHYRGRRTGAPTGDACGWVRRPTGAATEAPPTRVALQARLQGKRVGGGVYRGAYRCANRCGYRGAYRGASKENEPAAVGAGQIPGKGYIYIGN